MRIQIDLADDILHLLEVKAKQQNRTRKNYIEVLCIADAKKQNYTLTYNNPSEPDCFDDVCKYREGDKCVKCKQTD